MKRIIELLIQGMIPEQVAVVVQRERSVEGKSDLYTEVLDAVYLIEKYAKF